MKTTSLLVFAFACAAPVTVAQNCFLGTPAGIQLGNLQDIIYPAQPIGFAFPLAGASYTDIHISDHGLAFLSNGGVPPPPPFAAPFVYTPTPANFGFGNPIIAAMWSDTVGGGVNSGVFIDSSATRCRVEWRNMNSFGMSNRFSLAMTLFANGQIQFDYDASVTNNSTFGGLSDNGIAGVATGGGLPAPVDLSVGGSTGNDVVFENWITANTFDMQNNSLLLIPTNPGWIYFALGPSPSCATSINYGFGCGGDPADSIYEAYDASAFDLVGAPALQFLRILNGYVVLSGAGSFVPPGAGAQAVAPGQLDGQTSFVLSIPMPIAGGTATRVNITTKGNIEFTNVPVTIDFSPSVTELLDRPDTGFHSWHDFDQTTAGSITWQEIGGIGFATWNGVESVGASSLGTNTLQWQFDLTTGSVTLVVVSAAGIVDPTNLDGTVVGYSVAGVSVDPGPTDLGSISNPVVLGDTIAVSLPLALTANGAPTLGNSNFGHVLSNVPTLVPLAFLFFGDTVLNPGIPLDGIGMFGCAAWTNANLGAVSLPIAAGTGSFTLPIPGTASIVGVAFTTMGVAFSLATPLNLISSNGNLSTIGN